MSVRYSVAEYLRSRGFEMEPDPDPNRSFSQPLLSESNGLVDDLDDVNLDLNVPPKKAFHGTIKVKSDRSDNSTDDSTEFDDEIGMYRQFERRHTSEDHHLAPFHDHQCLSPSKPSAKVLIYLIYAIDFTVGSFLITRGLVQMRDENGNLMTSLLLGLMLLGGSISGMCLHSPLSKLFYDNDNGIGNRSLNVFNVAFGFIAFGVYYVLSLLLLTSMATVSSFVGTELGLTAKFALCIIGFTLSVGEVYRVIYVQYHHFGDETEEHSSTNGSTARLSAESEEVEHAESIPSVFVV